MPVNKMPDGRWYASFYYKDNFGVTRRKKKEGFRTRREAIAFEKSFIGQYSGSCDMAFETLYGLYIKSSETRLKESTIIKKKLIFRDKILPTFGKLRVSSITPLMIHDWQNLMMQSDYSMTYLRTINNDLAAVFKYAEQYYGLEHNPCRNEPRMGRRDAKTMRFWTLGQYKKAIAAVSDRELHAIYQTLFWTGMRRGECLALTVGDIDFAKKTISITKTRDRRKGKDIITAPKTEKSIRTVTMPEQLCTELQAYIRLLCEPGENELIFHRSPGNVSSSLGKAAESAGVPHIRVHDLRHSHASLLIEMGFTPLLIAERLGHESIDTTLRIYSHLYPNKQADVADRLSALE